MIVAIVSAYVLLGILTLLLTAYDPFARSFDWSLSGDGWEFSVWQRYVIGLVLFVASPYYLPREIHKKLAERKYVKEWRESGSFTKKID